MAVMENFWKLLLIFGTMPMLKIIPVPITMCSSGVVENNLDAIYEILNNTRLQKFFLFSVLMTPFM